MKTYLLLTFLLFGIGLSEGLTQNLWMLARDGGAYGQGSILSLDAGQSSVTVHHSFMSPAGYTPYGNLLQADDGKLYGTCYNGGAFGSCTLFQFDPSTGGYIDVYDFDIINGDFPTSGLIKDANGILYGTASTGGANSGGVLYSWNTISNTYTVLHSFTVSGGWQPYGAPVLHSNGKIYGLTVAGGYYTLGIIYSFDLATDSFTIEHSFNGITGSSPYGSLVEATNNKLYGMTFGGGTSGSGVIFSFDPATGTCTTLHNLTPSTGKYPRGSLMQATDGLLYGMTSEGGVNDFGVIFNFDLNTSGYNCIYHFDSINGEAPRGEFMQQGNELFGTAYNGGAYMSGTLFKFDITSYTFTKLVDLLYAEGANPTGGFIPVQLTGIPGTTSQEISIYPNPATASLSITLPHTLNDNWKISVMDISGKLLVEQHFIPAKENPVIMDVDALASGIYFMILDDGIKQIQHKFIKED